MDMETSLAKYGLRPDVTDLDEIRSLLEAEAAKERHRQGAGDTELMKLCCVQLFGQGLAPDALSIWRAKTSSMDADCSIDVQLLCGAGVGATKSYLCQVGTDESLKALQRIEQCEHSGDFDGFSEEDLMNFYSDYFGDED